MKAIHAYFLLEGGQSFGMAVVWTLATMYFVEALRLDPLQLVLLGTALEAAYFVTEIPTGVVADVYSRRLSILIGLALLGGSFVVAGLVGDFSLLIATQIGAGIGFTFLSGATSAWLAGEIGEAAVGPAVIRAGQIGRVAGIAGALVSAALAGLALNLPLLVGGLLLVGLAGVLAMGMPERGFKPHAPGGEGPWTRTWRGLRLGAAAVRAAPLLLMLCGLEVFMGASAEGVDRLGDAHLLTNFTFPALGGLSAGYWFAALRIAGALLTIVVVEPLRPRLERLTQRPTTVAYGLLAFDGLTVVAVALLAVAGNFWAAAGALLLRTVAFGLGDPLIQAWLVQNTKPETRATALSFVGQAHAFGEMAGGPGVGWIGSTFGLRTALLVAAVLLVPALPFYLVAARRSPEAEVAPAGLETVDL